MRSREGDAAVPLGVHELAAACVRYVDKALALPLDGTQDTLPILDHYLAEHAKGSPPEALALVLPAAGAYFGELVARTFADGDWNTDADDSAAWELYFARCSLRFNPVGLVQEVTLGVPGGGALTLAAQDRVRAKAILDEADEVPEEDFNRLTIRFETIERLYLALARA